MPDLIKIWGGVDKLPCPRQVRGPSDNRIPDPAGLGYKFIPVDEDIWLGDGDSNYCHKADNRQPCQATLDVSWAEGRFGDAIAVTVKAPQSVGSNYYSQKDDRGHLGSDSQA